MKLYAYRNCNTCRKAQSFLKQNGIQYEWVPIREHPPTLEELKSMLAFQDGQLRKLFNTSGQDYRKLGIKNVLPGMSEQDALQLLNTNGNLVKRPFLIGQKIGLVGFSETLWAELIDRS